MLRQVLPVFFGILCSLHLCGQPVLLGDEGQVDVNGNLLFLRDGSGRLTIEDVRGREFETFEPSSSPNFGFDRAPFWFRVTLKNTSRFHEWLLEVAYAPLDEIDIYVGGDDGHLIHKTSGDQYPITQRDLRHRHPIFEIEMTPGSEKQVFIRVQSISSVQVPITVWHRTAFMKTSYNIQLLNGLFYGAMLVMILYQLFLYFSSRSRITLFYVLTLISMVNVVAFFQGYGFLYLYPARPALNDIVAIFTGPAFVVCSTVLTRAFLEVRRFSKWLDIVLLSNMFIMIFVGLLTIVFFRRVSYEYHNYIILLHCMLALVAAAYCLYHKYKPARYYLIAWFTPLVAAVVFTIRSVGLKAGYLASNYTGLKVGCVLQTLFISLALGDRLRTLEKENQRARELERIRELEEKERLENEVTLRTKEIRMQNIQLEEVNNVKDKLFSVVSHDIKGPLNSLHLALTLAKSGTLSSEEFQQLSGRLEMRLVQTTEFIDTLLQWAKLQMRGETFEPEEINLVGLVSETVHLLEPECQQKGISLKNNIQGSLGAFADMNMIRSVLRNLVNNATKFTRRNGTITLNAYRVDNRIILSVADTGVGIPDGNRDRLFTPTSPTTQGTQQERGTGLGLLLCKQFVERNGGRIWFESELDKGTTFYFSLPLHQASRVVNEV
jgi:signal transduction histidine kinase